MEGKVSGMSLWKVNRDVRKIVWGFGSYYNYGCSIL